MVEVKARATPQLIQLATACAKTAAKGGENPMIIVPYLSGERLADLERDGMSGIDLCGNGIVQVPGRLLVLRSGARNLYPDSRPLNNPYRGHSAMAARMLLKTPRWDSLSGLAGAVANAGGCLSLAQISKAVQAMEEDLVVSKTGRVISLVEPLRLMDNLGAGWRMPESGERRALRLPDNASWPSALSSEPDLRWAITGESAAARYTVFSQGGPRRVAVSDLRLALGRIPGARFEPVTGFADLELVETDEPGFFFDNETDGAGVRWASRLQTWLELQSGDARQREAAVDLRRRVIDDVL